MISEDQYIQIISDSYRYHRGISEISKRVNLNRKTINTYILLARPYILDDRFDLRNEYLIRKLVSYLLVLKSCRRSPVSTPEAINDLRSLYFSLSTPKEKSPGEIYEYIMENSCFLGSDLINMSYSSIYRALSKIKSEYTD